MTPLCLNRFSLSLACLLVPRPFVVQTATSSHKLQRQNANKFTVISQASRQSSSMTSGLSYPKPIVTNSKQQHTATIFVLHGLGDTGDSWEDIASQFSSALPHVKWVFPTAPSRPITINGGMRMTGWYDILTLDKIAMEEDKDGLQESAKYVQSLIASEVAAGIPASRIVVAGFSQGGAVALLALRSDVKVAGVLALSTYLALPNLPPVVSSANKDTPVLMCHGTYDPVIRFEFGQMSFEKLKNEGASITFQGYEGMGHSVNAQELQKAVAFWQNCLPSKLA